MKKEADGYVLHALGSTGVTVNGLSVSSTCALREGDVVEIAPTVFHRRPP